MPSCPMLPLAICTAVPGAFATTARLQAIRAATDTATASRVPTNISTHTHVAGRIDIITAIN